MQVLYSDSGIVRPIPNVSKPNQNLEPYQNLSKKIVYIKSVIGGLTYNSPASILRAGTYSAKVSYFVSRVCAVSCTHLAHAFIAVRARIGSIAIISAKICAWRCISGRPLAVKPCAAWSLKHLSSNVAKKPSLLSCFSRASSRLSSSSTSAGCQVPTQ